MTNLHEMHQDPNSCGLGCRVMSTVEMRQTAADHPGADQDLSEPETNRCQNCETGRERTAMGLTEQVVSEPRGALEAQGSTRHADRSISTSESESRGAHRPRGTRPTQRWLQVSRSVDLCSRSFRGIATQRPKLVEFWWCLMRRDPQMCTFGVLGLSCETPASPKARGVASPCHFFHKFLQTSMLAHGDDFFIVGRREGRKHALNLLRGAYELSKARCGADLRTTATCTNAGQSSKPRAARE